MIWPFRKVNHFVQSDRITSYNVCYTKLLRGVVVDVGINLFQLADAEVVAYQRCSIDRLAGHQVDGPLEVFAQVHHDPEHVDFAALEQRQLDLDRFLVVGDDDSYNFV